MDQSHLHQVADAAQTVASGKTPYIASGLGGVFSVLTFNEIIGAIGVLISVMVAIFTAWSNHKRNKASIRASEAQQKLAEANIKPIE